MKDWNKYPIKIIEKKDFPEQLKEIKNAPRKNYIIEETGIMISLEKAWLWLEAEE